MYHTAWDACSCSEVLPPTFTCVGGLEWSVGPAPIPKEIGRACMPGVSQCWSVDPGGGGAFTRHVTMHDPPDPGGRQPTTCLLYDNVGWIFIYACALTSRPQALVCLCVPCVELAGSSPRQPQSGLWRAQSTWPRRSTHVSHLIISMENTPHLHLHMCFRSRRAGVPQPHR